MKIKTIKDPIVFIALKRVCNYVINDGWEVHMSGRDVVEAEFKLAVAKSKEFEKDIKDLANLDDGLDWGDERHIEGSGSYTAHEGDFNPWYKGEISLPDLLYSIEPLVDFYNTGDNYIENAELVHYFGFLKEFAGIESTDNSESPEDIVKKLKSIMIDVATGNAKIQEMNDDYQDLYRKVDQYYRLAKVEHQNNFSDLWEFYAYWKERLSTYADRRAYISRLYRIIPDLNEQKPVLKSRKNKYIDEERIKELRGIRSKNFDLSRLIRYCEELNIAFDNDCFLATAMLARSILDHVPPIFGVDDFAKVAGKGTRSFKESMSRLNRSLRKIADSHLHTQIRPKESLPNTTQIDFSNDIDILLGEILRQLK